MDVPKPYFVSGFIPTLYIYIRDDMPAKKNKKKKKMGKMEKNTKKRRRRNALHKSRPLSNSSS
jgi:hypothetical protein